MEKSQVLVDQLEISCEPQSFGHFPGLPFFGATKKYNTSKMQNNELRAKVWDGYVSGTSESHINSKGLGVFFRDLRKGRHLAQHQQILSLWCVNKAREKFY